MAAQTARSDDALSALPFRSSLKGNEFNTAKIKFESGRSMDEMMPALYTSRKESYSFNPFASDAAPMRSALETYMEEEGVGHLLLRHQPLQQDTSPAPAIISSKPPSQDGPGADEAAIPTPFPAARRELEPFISPLPTQLDLAHQFSRSDNALPILNPYPMPSLPGGLTQHLSTRPKLDSSRSDSEAAAGPADVGGRKDAAPSPLLPNTRSYIHISTKLATESSRSDDDSSLKAPLSSWKGPDSSNSSSSKIKFESRRQETRNNPSGYSDYHSDSRRDSSDGSKDTSSRECKASYPDIQQRQRRPHAIEHAKLVCSDRHSSPGVLVDIPWLRTDDIASLDCVAVGSASGKDWIDEIGNRTSPEFSPAGNKSRKVQIAMAAQEESSTPTSVASDSHVSDVNSAEQKRTWMQGNRAKSDRQLLAKNRETMVGRGQSFPAGVGVVSAEPSGEWWSPSALRMRLDSRATRQSSRASHVTHDLNSTSNSNSVSVYSDSPGDDMRHAGSATAMRASAFQSSMVQRDLEQELQQHGGDPAQASFRGARQSQFASPAAASAWQTARPTKGLETLSAEPIMEESEHLEPDDRKSHERPLRKDTVVKLAALRSRRNPRISMPLMPGEDVPDLSQAHAQKSADFKQFREAATAAPRASQQEQGADFKSYRGDLAMSKIMSAHHDPSGVLSPSAQKRAQQSMYRNA